MALPIARVNPEGSMDRAAATRRCVTFGLLAWAVLFPGFLWMSRAFPYDSGAWFVGVIGVGLFAAVMALIVILFVPLAFHEMGHLLAGRLVGFKPYLLVLGPFGWRKTEGAFRFYWTGYWIQCSGLAGASPLDSRNLRNRTAIFILGGPLASLILAIPGARVGYYVKPFRSWVGASMPSSGGSAHALLWLLLAAWGFVSVSGLACGLLWPRSGPLRADISALTVLLRGYPHASRYAAVAALYFDGLNGVPAGEWPSSWIEAATCLSDVSADDAYGCYFAFTSFFARKDYGRAGKFLTRAREASSTLPADGRAAILMESAFFVLQYEQTVDAPILARRWFERAKRFYPASSIRLRRIESAVLFSEGAYAAALAKATQALKGLDALSAPAGSDDRERAFLERLITEIVDSRGLRPGSDDPPC